MGPRPARASQPTLRRATPTPPQPTPALLLLGLLLLLQPRGALSAGARLGGGCATSRECAARVMYSECREGGCSCRANLLASTDGRRCLQPLKLHYRCEDDVQCSGVPHAACLLDERGNQLCACSARHVLHDERCLPRSQLHEACEVSVQCSKNMECEGGRCVCRGFAFELNRQCVTDVDDYVSLESSSAHLASSLPLISIFLLLLL